MSNANVTFDTVQDYGYPSADVMVEMVNNDLLPFFEKHFPTNVGEVKVVSLIKVEYPDFIFERADGNSLAVWESYFQNPKQWKQHRLATRK